MQNNPVWWNDPYGYGAAIGPIGPLPPTGGPSSGAGGFCAWNVFWEEWAEMQADRRDSYHHCMATCRVFRECGEFSGWTFFCGGQGKESFQMFKNGFDVSLWDCIANTVGADAGRNDKDCDEACNEAFPKDFPEGCAAP